MLYLVNGITTYIPNLEFLASTNSYHPRRPGGGGAPSSPQFSGIWEMLSISNYYKPPN